MDKINIRRSQSNARRDAALSTGIILRIRRDHPGNEDSYFITGLVGIDEIAIIDVMGRTGGEFKTLWQAEIADLVNPEPLSPEAEQPVEGKIASLTNGDGANG